MPSDVVGQAPIHSTYRLQLGPQLTFEKAAELADYLAALGVTHAYLSPILAAATGSTHGYDVINPTRINPDLGGRRGFDALVEQLRARSIGVVLDIVPNHMAIPTPESSNPALWSVLLKGQDSEFADWFDIDWGAADDRLVLPVLDGPLEENLGRLTIEHRGGQAVAVRYFHHRFPIADGTGALPLSELLNAQHYRLTDWRATASELNYRRFMDVTSLIGVRVEDPSVFDATHAVIVDLVQRKRITGVRVDHPDGLADPGAYLDRLYVATDGAWTVVEKVLAGGEPLALDWKTAGTTGYDALAIVNSLLVDPQGDQPLSRMCAEITGDSADFAAIALASKRWVMLSVLTPEVDRLTRLLRNSNESTHEQALRNALQEVLCRLAVYRPFAASRFTLHALDDAVAAATTGNPTLTAEIELIARHAGSDGEFSRRFGQTAAAVFAKGVEDTAFYRYTRLLSLNEVGGDPGRFGTSLDDFHDFATRVQERSPSTMTTLSTHDTKRSEDVRARISVLSEMADEWETAIERWMPISEKFGCPDARTAYFFWQTLVGAWPLDPERACTYMEKAVREAKLATSWANPDARYERAVRDFVATALDDNGLLADVGMFVAAIEPFAAANSLVQKLIQLTMPGVPDVYQGCELATFTLVDPDNRKPVDFDVRRESLESLLDDKLRVTATALRLRRSHPEWFTTYSPIRAVGSAADHVVAFARSDQLITVAARFCARLRRDGGWRDTSLAIPRGAWIDALSGREYAGGGRLMADVLAGSCVALLVPAVSVTT